MTCFESTFYDSALLYQPYVQHYYQYRRSGYFKCLYRGILLYLLHFYCYTQGRIFLDKDIFNVKETFHMINKGYIKFTFPNIDCSFYLWQECVFWVEMTWYHRAIQTCLTDYRPTGYYFFSADDHFWGKTVGQIHPITIKMDF